MTVRTRIEPIDRDIALIFSEELSPAARSATLARYAREQFGEAAAVNRRVLGRVPPYRTFVDGSEGAALEQVRPDGVIAFEFELIADLLLWIGAELERVSPVRTGRYRSSHTLFADGVEVSVGATVPDAREFVFLSDLPYARKIELGKSKQAPKGVYELTAAKAARRFGNIARVRFSFRAPFTGRLRTGRTGNASEARVPAIVVTFR